MKHSPYYARLQPHHEQLIQTSLQREWIESEKSTKKHERIQRAKQAGLSAGKTLLKLALVAGALTIAAVAPGAFAVFAPSRTEDRTFLSAKNLPQVLRSGRARRYWQFKKTNATTYSIVLSPAGKRVALHQALQTFTLARASSWDGLWRMAIFDISKKSNGARDALRHRLLQNGMYPLQGSVFIYPYPCHDEVMMWAELFGVQDDVEVLESRFLTDREPELRRIFHLPLAPRSSA